MSEMQQTIAQVRVNSNGEWKLLVKGTDIYVSLYRNRHPDLDPFPGNAMGHRLIELGWMPDRRAAIMPSDAPMVEKLTATMHAGWTPSDTEKWVWTIPVYREVD